VKNISWLNLIGGIAALALALAHFGGLAYLIGAVPLIVIIGLGIALMAYDLVLTTREESEKRQR
jgi:hypothetical protein